MDEDCHIEEEETRSSADEGDKHYSDEGGVDERCKEGKNSQEQSVRNDNIMHHNNRVTPTRRSGGRSSETTIKMHAMKTGVMETQWTQSCRCKGTTHPERCLITATMSQVQAEREWVFGPISEPPPSTKQKWDKLQEAIVKRMKKSPASSTNANNGDQYHVTLLNGVSSSQIITVCESAYLVIVGLSNSIDRWFLIVKPTINIVP